MSEKVKKQASSLSFSLSRWFQRISTAKPSTFIVSIIVISAAVFLFSGGLYDIINAPAPAVYYQPTGSAGRFYFLYPALDTQFIFDTVVAGILYAIGFIGLVSIYQSSRHAYNPRQAYMTMILGATLLFIAYLFVEYFIHLKLTGA